MKNENMRKSARDILHYPCSSSEDVYKCNQMLVDMLQKVASLIENSRPVPTKKGPKSHREPWFDDELKNLKSQRRKLSRWLCKFPCNQTLRHRLFERKKVYRQKIRVKKQEFIKYINKSIEDETSISWSNLQGLKNFQEKRNDLDVYDMANFIEFFTTFYQTKPLPTSTLHQFEVKCTPEDKSIDTTTQININGKQIKPAPGTCVTYNIYMIRCKLCNKPYVGKSTRMLRNRFGEHRRAFYKALLIISGQGVDTEDDSNHSKLRLLQ